MRFSKTSSVTWPPPASSAQWPALAAAATILASTVVGVMPASRIGERPVKRVNEVSTTTRPSGSVTVAGAKVEQPGGARRDCLLDRVDPVDRVDQHAGHEFPRELDIESAQSGPVG